MAEEIKAVIFDWGGVMIDDPWPGLRLYCASKLKVAPVAFEESFNKYMESFQTNSVSEVEFWELICRELKAEKPSVFWKQAFQSVYKPKQEMFLLAESLQKSGCKTALLSNTEVPAMNFFMEQKYNCFDIQVFSCAEGIRKPAKKIYEDTVKKIVCKPQETIFIDDKPQMIEGAKKAGLNAILFESVEQVKKELINFGLKF
jgi:epoxide hydrolase-like predicted phosphatase